MPEIKGSAGEGISTPIGGESASVSVNVWGTIVILLAAAAALFYYAKTSGGTDVLSKTPRYEVEPNIIDTTTNSNPNNIFGALNNIIAVPGDLGDQSTGHEWRQPDYDCRKNVWTRHRYPYKTGTNLSAIYHKGWQPMMRPAEYDADWMELPPTEVTIGGYDAGSTIAYN